MEWVSRVVRIRDSITHVFVDSIYVYSVLAWYSSKKSSETDAYYYGVRVRCVFDCDFFTFPYKQSSKPVRPTAPVWVSGKVTQYYDRPLKNKQRNCWRYLPQWQRKSNVPAQLPFIFYSHHAAPLYFCLRRLSFQLLFLSIRCNSRKKTA